MNRLSIILSSLALVVALTAGGAYAASSTVLNGANIKNHTIGLAKLTPKAVKQLKGQRGARLPRPGWLRRRGRHRRRGRPQGDRRDRRDRRDRPDRRLRPQQGHVRERPRRRQSCRARRTSELVATCPWDEGDLGRLVLPQHGSTYLSQQPRLTAGRGVVWIDTNARVSTEPAGHTRSAPPPSPHHQHHEQRPGRFVTVGAQRVFHALSAKPLP